MWVLCRLPSYFVLAGFSRFPILCGLNLNRLGVSGFAPGLRLDS